MPPPCAPPGPLRGVGRPVVQQRSCQRNVTELHATGICQGADVSSRMQACHVLVRGSTHVHRSQHQCGQCRQMG